MQARRRLAVIAILALILVTLPSRLSIAQQAARGSVSGTVRDGQGALVEGAKVWLIHTQQAVLRSTVTGNDGRFSFSDIAPGAYEVRVTRSGFSSRRLSAKVGSGEEAGVDVLLEVAPLADTVTVTAEAGQIEERDRIAQSVNVIPEESVMQRSKSVLAQVANEEVGLSLQRTSPTIGAIFVRGLTGKNVSTYVDGVRYSTSTGRGGINTFFNLNEASNQRVVEVLRGPNSAQYASDSLGGTVNLVSRSPIFGGDEPEFHGELNTIFTSADLSFGGNTFLSYGTDRLGVYANVAARRANKLRSADGLDGHAAVTRFLGLPSNIFGDRLPDTAFTQYDGTVHMNFAPATDQQFIFHYTRSQQDGGKRYDQLLGGDGNLIADLRNLMLDFLYVRYVKQDLWIFDNGSFTFSYNGQREERVNQGGQGNPLAGITHQYERTNVFGFSFFVDKRLFENNTFLFGGDVYRETVNAPAYTFSPVSRLSTPSRPRVPDGATYLSFGGYIQDIWEAIPNKLRFSGALRYNVASYRSEASNSPIVNGAALWPNDSLRVSDLSGRIGTVVTPIKDLNISFNYSRGFRAPNVTDLGTLGLTGDGFESDFFSASALHGTIGSTAGADAVNTGIAVSRQASEVSNNFDLGFRYRRGRFDASSTGFIIDINNAIVKQALILSPGAVGQMIGGQPIINQLANGAVIVPLSASPVLIRANFTDARIMGWESTFGARLSREWFLAGNFTMIRAYEKATGLPPNIEGGTPPAAGFLRLRYEPLGRHYWVEAYSTLADRQSRLSSLDLNDRRTGATRSRGQIASFFNNGARVRGLIGPGLDNTPGTIDDVLLPTGEVLSQVQNRVLGSANSAPLFRYLPGYGLFGVRGGYRFTENSEFNFDLENLFDQQYRGPSWGLDGAGRSVTFRYSQSF